MLRKIIRAGEARRPNELPMPSIGLGRSRPQIRPGLGDHVERLVKPVAIALRRTGLTACLDSENKLRPDSPCAKRKARLNQLGKKLGL